ncbi:MAG TPA: hypothetical protein VGF67_00245 [Ktedonobacteraceae bacterium]|jgi:hypothetical protein
MPVVDTTFSWSKRGGQTRRYLASFGPSRPIGQQAGAAAQALCDDPTRSVVVIGDGAQWIKKEAGRHFPQATCILDWAHLWREVRQAIMAAARATSIDPSARDSQLHFQRSRLWLDSTDLALDGLRDLATGLPAQFLKPIQDAIRSVEHQRSWMGSSEAWPRLGSPVGSRVIECAVSIVINRRMKKRGLRWCRPNATAIVALRADWLNDDWVTPQRLRASP